ncbi:MAG: hypothetical protein ACK5UL_01610, partial [bacterium]
MYLQSQRSELDWFIIYRYLSIMSLNFSRTRDLLSNFQFGELFIEELGWSHPRAKKTVSITVD